MNTLLPARVPIAAQWVWSNFELWFPDVDVLEMYISTDAAASAAASAAAAAAAAQLRNGPLDSASCRGPKTEQESWNVFRGQPCAKHQPKRAFTSPRYSVSNKLVKSGYISYKAAERPP
jgi:hypothetical protein